MCVYNLHVQCMYVHKLVCKGVCVIIYRSIDDDTTDDASSTLLITTIQKPKLRHGHGISGLWLDHVKSHLESTPSSKSTSESLEKPQSNHLDTSDIMSTSCFNWLEAEGDSSISGIFHNGRQFLSSTSGFFSGEVSTGSSLPVDSSEFHSSFSNSSTCSDSSKDSLDMVEDMKEQIGIMEEKIDNMMKKDEWEGLFKRMIAIDERLTVLEKRKKMDAIEQNTNAIEEERNTIEDRMVAIIEEENIDGVEKKMNATKVNVKERKMKMDAIKEEIMDTDEEIEETMEFMQYVKEKKMDEDLELKTKPQEEKDADYHLSIPDTSMSIVPTSIKEPKLKR